MEALIWETADELDQKLASRLRNIRETPRYFTAETGGHEWGELWLN